MPHHQVGQHGLGEIRVPIHIVCGSGGVDLPRLRRELEDETFVFDDQKTFRFETESQDLPRVKGELENFLTDRALIVSDQLVIRAGAEGWAWSDTAREIRELSYHTGAVVGLVALVPDAPGRTREIDRVVALEAGEGALATAISSTARGMALKLPPPHVVHDDLEESIIRLHAATTKEQLRACFKLRFKVYGLMSYLDPELAASPAQMELDFFDKSSLHFVAIEHKSGKVIGTSRLVVRSHSLMATGLFTEISRRRQNHQSRLSTQIVMESGDPTLYQRWQQTYAFSLPIFQSAQFSKAWIDLSGPQENCEISRVIVDPVYRGRGVSRLLMRGMISVAHELKMKAVLLECAPHHIRMYQGYGFEVVEGLYSRVQELDQVAAGMRLDLEDMPHNSPTQMAKRDIAMIMSQPDPDPTVGPSRYLCMCDMPNCWQQGSYQFHGKPQCPLHGFGQS